MIKLKDELILGYKKTLEILNNQKKMTTKNIDDNEEPTEKKKYLY